MLRKTMIGLVIVALCASPVQGDILIFSDPLEFENFNLEHGKFLKGIENFEEADVPPGEVSGLDDPLQFGVPNIGQFGWGFQNGLAEQNIIIQSNMGPHPNPPAPNPRGAEGLTLFGPDVSGGVPISNAVGVSWPNSDSLDLIFLEPNHTGIGFNVSSFGSNNCHIAVYGENDVLITTADTLCSLVERFFGVWSDQAIGRINIDGQGSFGVPVDNIQMWVPEPATLPLLALGGIAMIRRRRRR